MKGVAIEGWSFSHEAKITNWLFGTFGPPSKEVWNKDYDYDFITLVMSDDIYLLYMLKWGK